MFAFVDESSFPRPQEDSAHSVLLAACINEREIRYLTQRVYQLKEQVFGGGNDVEIKAKNFVVPKVLRPDRTRNKEFADKLFEVLDGLDIGVYAIIMERPDYEPFVEPDKLPKHYTFLMQRIDAYAKAHQDSVSVVFDGQDARQDEDVSRRFNNLVFRSRSMNQVIEMPLFVSSKIVPGIQIADIMAGVTRHYHNENLHNASPTSEWQAWIEEKYAIIEKKSGKQRIGGSTVHGMYIMGKHALPRPV